MNVAHYFEFFFFFFTFQFRPGLLIIGSHHAVHIGSMEPPPGVDLTSVVAVAPLGAAIHANIVKELKALFPNMMEVYKVYFLSKLHISQLIVICFDIKAPNQFEIRNLWRRITFRKLSRLA